MYTYVHVVDADTHNITYPHVHDYMYNKYIYIIYVSHNAV